jgi:dihydroorotase-like cyclic amidohydrolase
MRLDVQAALLLEAEDDYNIGLKRLDYLLGKPDDQLSANERSELNTLARGIRIYEDEGTPLHIQGIKLAKGISVC